MSFCGDGKERPKGWCEERVSSGPDKTLEWKGWIKGRNMKVLEVVGTDVECGVTEHRGVEAWETCGPANYGNLRCGKVTQAGNVYRPDWVITGDEVLGC